MTVPVSDPINKAKSSSPPFVAVALSIASVTVTGPEPASLTSNMILGNSNNVIGGTNGSAKCNYSFFQVALSRQS